MINRTRVVYAGLLLAVALPISLWLISVNREVNRVEGVIERLRGRGVAVRIAAGVGFVPRPTKATYGLDSKLRPMADTPARFTDDDVTDLNALPTITAVSFHGVVVDREVVASLRRLQHLTYLELEKGAIKERQFVALAQLPKLRILTLQYISVEAEAIEALRALRPDVEVQVRAFVVKSK